MATLSLKNIDKIYDNNVQAVFDFNLDIADKDVYKRQFLLNLKCSSSTCFFVS